MWPSHPAWALLALPVLACSGPPPAAPCPDARLPVHDELAWDPNAPLILAFSHDELSHEAAGLLSRVRLRTADGASVELVGASRGSVVYLCPIGGLAPGGIYVWEVDPLGAPTANSLSVPPFSYEGVSVFRTAEESSRQPAVDEASCRQLALSEQTPCYADLIPEEDTGETGDPGDSP